jgi:hypothetical protein
MGMNSMDDAPLTANPDAADYLAYAVALIATAGAEFEDIRKKNPALAAEVILRHLGYLHAELSAAADRLGIRPDRYADGRAVVSTLDLGTRTFVKTWHPDADHAVNACREAGVIKTDHGDWCVIVSAPGHLDARPMAADSAEAVDDLGHRAMIWPR